MKTQDGEYNESILQIWNMIWEDTGQNSIQNIFMNGILMVCPVWMLSLFIAITQTSLNGFWWILLIVPQVSMIMLVSKASTWEGSSAIIDSLLSTLLYGFILLIFSIFSIITKDLLIWFFGVVIHGAYSCMLFIMSPVGNN